MPEEKQDPANTQMFRAFVERGEQEPQRRVTLAALVALAVILVAVAVTLVLILT